LAKSKRALRGTDKGDQYVFLAIAGAAKAILSYCVGKRNQEHTSAFVAELRARVLGAPEISSDGWNCYPGAIEDAFGIDVTYGQIEKHYGVQAAMGTVSTLPVIFFGYIIQRHLVRGLSFAICLAASSPFNEGIVMSRIATSGWSSVALVTASLPSFASAAICHSGCS